MTKLKKQLSGHKNVLDDRVLVTNTQKLWKFHSWGSYGFVTGFEAYVCKYKIHEL